MLLSMKCPAERKPSTSSSCSISFVAGSKFSGSLPRPLWRLETRSPLLQCAPPSIPAGIRIPDSLMVFWWSSTRVERCSAFYSHSQSSYFTDILTLLLYCSCIIYTEIYSIRTFVVSTTTTTPHGLSPTRLPRFPQYHFHTLSAWRKWALGKMRSPLATRTLFLLLVAL